MSTARFSGRLSCTTFCHACYPCHAYPRCGQNNWHTLLKILPCPKLLLWAVIKKVFITDFGKYSENTRGKPDCFPSRGGNIKHTPDAADGNLHNHHVSLHRRGTYLGMWLPIVSPHIWTVLNRRRPSCLLHWSQEPHWMSRISNQWSIFKVCPVQYKVQQ